MLAPEEVFSPSSSDMRARSELTPAEKRAVRNKDKKRKRKMRDTLDHAAGSGNSKTPRGAKSVKQQKEEALKSVVKSGRGVTVIGKKSKDVISDKRVGRKARQ
jgi:U3 small nucleolar RNA-associated protein MPP10